MVCSLTPELIIVLVKKICLKKQSQAASLKLFIMFTDLTRFYLSISACVPVLQVSFISLQRSFTEEALLPRAAPMVAQSLPCLILSLKGKRMWAPGANVLPVRGNRSFFVGNRKSRHGSKNSAVSEDVMPTVYALLIGLRSYRETEALFTTDSECTYRNV